MIAPTQVSPEASMDLAWLLLALGALLTVGIAVLFVWFLRHGGDGDA